MAAAAAPDALQLRDVPPALLLCVLLLAVIGCGSGKLVPVSGRVTLDGEPVAGASVVFQPTGGNDKASEDVGFGSYARTLEDGTFQLKCIVGDRSGAVPGTHTVFVTTNEDTTEIDDSGNLRGETIPRPWRNGERTFEVPPDGTDQAFLEIRSDEVSALESNVGPGNRRRRRPRNR